MVETENKTVKKAPLKSRKQRKKLGVKIAYAVILTIIVIICGVQAALQLTNSVSATVMIDSIYAAKGQNPDGTPFSIMELFCDDIMNDAAEKLGGELTAQELRTHLSISDTMTGNSFTQFEQSIFDGEDENTYFPAQYLVTYSTISEQIRNEDFLTQCKILRQSFSLTPKTEILNAVLQSYQEYYAQMHVNYDSALEIDWSVVDSMDYYNRYEYMNDTVLRLMRFLQYKNSHNESDNDTVTNAGYDDLIAEFSKGPLQGLNNYQAYVTQNGITNDKDALLREFVYMQNLCEEENTRKMQEYDVVKEAIEMYDSTTTEVVFIPALDDNKEFYMNRTKVGLDYLTEKADAAKLQADSAAYTAKEYSYLRACFGDEDTIDEILNGQQIKNTPEQRSHADALYKTLKDEIQRLTTQAELLTTEEQKVNQNNLSISEPFCSASIVSVGISSAKRFVILFFAAYVLVFITMAAFKKKQK